MQPDGTALTNKNKGINRCREAQGTDKNHLSKRSGRAELLTEVEQPPKAAACENALILFDEEIFFIYISLTKTYTSQHPQIQAESLRCPH